jgi:hypothetical protein
MSRRRRRRGWRGEGEKGKEEEIGVDITCGRAVEMRLLVVISTRVKKL